MFLCSLATSILSLIQPLTDGLRGFLLSVGLQPVANAIDTALFGFLIFSGCQLTPGFA